MFCGNRRGEWPNISPRSTQAVNVHTHTSIQYTHISTQYTRTKVMGVGFRAKLIALILLA